jgi:hypothetical protein
MKRSFAPSRRPHFLRRALPFLVCGLLVGALAPATAMAGPPGLEHKLDASVVGTVTINRGSACGGLVVATTDASLFGSPALGTATLHVDICVTSVTPNDLFFGTFELRSRLGTITGTAVISSPDPPGADPQRITGTLTPTGGTGPFARVDGPLTVNVQSHGPYPAPLTGTVSAPA